MNDPRFSNFATDPKYKNISKGVRKIEVNDKRFSHMFTDKRFSNKAKVDEYGNKIKKSNFNEDLEDFYTRDNVIIEGKNKIKEKYNKIDKNKKSKSNPHDEILKSNENEEVESQDEDYDKIWEKNQKKTLITSSLNKDKQDDDFCYNSDEYRNSDNSSDTSDQFDEFLNDYIEKQNQEKDAWDKYKDSNIPLGDATKRISILNLNWETINSKDLFIILESLSPKPGMLKSVAIYPSDFGIKELEKEKIYGPDLGIYKSSSKSKQETTLHSIEQLHWQEKQKEFNGYDEGKLREYELKKLKFYYAVAEFKSVKISNFIYENYDGIEIQRTQMFLDMRFVPDDLEFPYKPKEVCSSFPQNYEMNIKSNRAMNHSKVRLTWDEDNENRSNLLKKAFQNQFNEDEIQELLVSSDDEEDEDAKKIAEILLKEDEEEKLKGQNEIKLVKKKKDRGPIIKDGVDIDVVFDVGFEGLDKNALSNKTDINTDIKEMTDKKSSLYDQFKERKKVIGKQKKMEEKLKREDKKQRRKFKQEDLDLLLQEDNFDEDTNNKIRYEKSKIKDSRFEAIKNDKKYWIDPTNRNFKNANKKLSKNSS